MPIKNYEGKIKNIIEQTNSVKLFTIELEETFQFKAGQFINLAFQIEDNNYMKPYSIASMPKNNNKELKLSIKLVPEGRVTPKLWTKKIGDKISLKGPFGLFQIRNKQEKLAFIGTGTGIAPLRSMIFDLLINKKINKEIVLIFGVRYENEILFDEEFTKLMNSNPNFKYIKIISRPTENWIGRKGHVQDNFDFLDVNNSEFYICGLPLMFEEVHKKLLDMGALKENIYHEVFR